MWVTGHLLGSGTILGTPTCYAESVRGLETAARRGSLKFERMKCALTIQRFNLSTIHEATARVLLRDISKILFPNNPVNVPVIK